MGRRALHFVPLFLCFLVLTLPAAASRALDFDVSGNLRMTSADAVIDGVSENLRIQSEDSMVFKLDMNGDGGPAEAFSFRRGDTNTELFRIYKSGTVQVVSPDAALEGASGNFRVHSEDSLVIKLDSNNDATGSEGIYFRKGNNADLVTMLENGKVGIGVTTPEEKLHVVGNVKVTGNIAAKYQDVAEWVDAASPLEAGTVVVIQESAANGVEASRRAYDAAVAGVVSAQPGVVLGEPGAGKVLVAQSGRVRVKVDAGTSGIKPGDLLVTSSVGGHAMKSTPLSIGGQALHRPGTVLGKALEPLARGKGEILVLITLQ